MLGTIPAITPPNLIYTLGSHGHLHTRLQEAKQFKNVDILFLGSSHAYRGFDVRVFEKHGLRAFNMGSSSQTPIQTKLLLDRYITSLNPKLIIYAVSPDIFCSDGVEGAIDVISNDKNDLLSIYMAGKINNPKVYNTWIYGNIRELFNLNANFKQAEHLKCGERDFDTYIHGGYVEKSTDNYFNSNEIKHQQTEMRFKKYQLNAFKEMIQDIKNRGIDLILVRTPVSKSKYHTTDEFDNMMQVYGKYYDFNKIFNFTDSCFYDASHLRQEAADSLSETIFFYFCDCK